MNRPAMVWIKTMECGWKTVYIIIWWNVLIWMRNYINCKGFAKGLRAFKHKSFWTIIDLEVL